VKGGYRDGRSILDSGAVERLQSYDSEDLNLPEKKNWQIHQGGRKTDKDIEHKKWGNLFGRRVITLILEGI